MSVFGGILLFAAGVATGSGLVIANRVNVQRETAQLRRDNENLRNSAWHDKLEHESSRAYRQGYHDGRFSPASEAERFAEFVEDRNIDFRGQRRRSRHAETDS